MSDYRLTTGAEDDLLQIAVYTIETWGLEQAARYEQALVTCFEAICRGDAHASTPLPHRPEVQATRCEHHYVFFARDLGPCIVILAVLHENMDLMRRLRERLGTGKQ